MKKVLLFLSLLFVGCAPAKPEQINPLAAPPVVDNVITEPEDCVYSTEVDPKGRYYFVSGFESDGLLATSEVSCDDAFAQWLRMGLNPVRLLKA
jgi:hypothetical protein